MWQFNRPLNCHSPTRLQTMLLTRDILKYMRNICAMQTIATQQPLSKFSFQVYSSISFFWGCFFCVLFFTVTTYNYINIHQQQSLLCLNGLENPNSYEISCLKKLKQWYSFWHILKDTITQMCYINQVVFCFQDMPASLFVGVIMLFSCQSFLAILLNFS